MKKNKKKTEDLEKLKLWKYTSTKGKLHWLESALRFVKFKKF